MSHTTNEPFGGPEQSNYPSIVSKYFLKLKKVPGSDAEKSNVKINDIIACINGIELKNESIHECANLMANSKEYVDFKLKRVVQNKE